MAKNTVNIKRDRFIRIAEGRTTVVLSALEKLGRCANKNNYEYSEKDTKEIFGEINKKLKEIRSMFREGPEKKGGFKLSRHPLGDGK